MNFSHPESFREYEYFHILGAGENYKPPRETHIKFGLEESVSFSDPSFFLFEKLNHEAPRQKVRILSVGVFGVFLLSRTFFGKLEI